MSEVTYKKIVDVEQIDALGEGTTLFVNDGGSMKQMGAAALGAVKSVNGVLPDENGEVKATELIQFADYSAIMPGRILYGGTYTMQEIVNKLFNGEHQRYEVVISILNPANGIRTDRKVTTYEQIVTGDDRLLTGVKLYYGDEACPIILDGVNNTITLDPDWVAPEADPEPTGAHQMLVTGTDGSTKWEDRTHWADSNLDVVLPEVMIDKKTAYLNDYTSYTRNLQQGHTYHVVCDGAEYQCSPVWNDALYSYTIGNASLASLGSDTGEPFFINAHNNTQMTIIYFSSEGQHTIAIDEGMIDTIHPLDPKYLPEDHINGMIDSKLEGVGGGSSDGVILVGQWDENDNYVYPDETLIAALTALKQYKAVVYKNDPDINNYSYILSWILSPQSPDGYRYLNFYVHSSDTAEIEKIQIAVNPSIVPDGM